MYFLTINQLFILYLLSYLIIHTRHNVWLYLTFEREKYNAGLFQSSGPVVIEFITSFVNAVSMYLPGSRTKHYYFIQPFFSSLTRACLTLFTLSSVVFSKAYHPMYTVSFIQIFRTHSPYSWQGQIFGNEWKKKGDKRNLNWGWK